MAETAIVPSSWIERYPEKYRNITETLGVRDEGYPLLVKFNKALMDRYDYCEGKHRHVSKVLLNDLLDDWWKVLEDRSREIPENWANSWSGAQHGAT